MSRFQASLRALVITVALIVGCAPTAAPSATTAPPKAAAPTTAPAAAPQATQAPAKPADAAKPAAKAPTTLAELASYQGADRQAVLEAGAKNEGQLVWYTEMQGDVVAGLKEEFQKKYPFIQVSEYRISGDEMTQKLREEFSANRPATDVIEAGTDIMLVLKALNIPAAYWSSELAAFPENAKEPASNGQAWWTVVRQSFIGYGYNTKLLGESTVPKSYADLLKPELKDKIVWSGTGSTGGQVMGTMIATMGADYPQKLAAQNYTVQQVSGKALLDLIVAGEVAASPTIYRNHVLQAKSQGAPVEWVPLEPVTTSAGAATLSGKSPHPHAALLFIDFLLGKDGQAVLEKFQYGSPSKDYGFKVVYPSTGMTAQQYDQKINEWSKIMRDNARKG